MYQDMDYKYSLGSCLVIGLVLLTAGQDEQSREVTADTLLFTTIQIEPFVMLEQSPTGLFRFTGFMVELWEEMNNVMEQPYDKYIFQPVRDNMYGRLYENGSWSGMIGEVFTGKADAAMAPLAVTNRREEAVDFTIPFLQISMAVLVRKELNISSIEELMDSTKVNYGSYDKSHVLRKVIANSKKPLLRRMDKYMTTQGPFVLVATTSQGLEKVLTDDYAFIGGSDTLEYLAVQNCDLMTFTFMNYKNYSIALEKGSRYTEEFSQAIEILLDNGTVQALYDNWWRKAEPCTPAPTAADIDDDNSGSQANSQAGATAVMAASMSYSLLSVTLVYHF